MMMATKSKRSQLLWSALLLVVIFVSYAHGAREHVRQVSRKNIYAFAKARRTNIILKSNQLCGSLQHQHSRDNAKHESLLMIPRGGGGMGLSPTSSLQIFTVIYLIQGPICMLAPRLNARVYGIQTSELSPDNDALVAFLMRGCGTLITGLGVFSWLAQKNENLEVAVAASNIFVVLNLIVSSVVGVPGIPKSSFLVGLVLAGMALVLPLLASYRPTKLVSTELARAYLLGYMAFGAWNGLVGALAPGVLSKPWKFDIADTQAAYTLTRSYGTWCLGYCICSLLVLSQNRSLETAVGWGSLPAFVLLLAGNLITMEFERLGMNKGVMLFWFLFNVFVLTPMLI